MNILFLTDNFSNGGLETHITDLSETLIDAGHKTFLAHGSEYSDTLYRHFCGGLPNLSLRYDNVIGQTLDTIQILGSFIDEHKIDVIHAHPFFSFSVGAIIADQKNLPLICTIHGPSSVDGAPGLNPIALWPEIISHSHMIAVSQELGEVFNDRYGTYPDIQPNTAKIKRIPIELNGKLMIWAGRLDSDKVHGLYKLLDILDDLPEWQLDIAGEGPEVPNLMKAISEKPLRQGRMKLLGWLDNIQNFMPQYDVVAGMGRVIIEASGLSIPSLLVGYDEVKCFMSSASADRAAVANFSGRSLTASTHDEIISEITSNKFRSYGNEMAHWIKDNRSPQIIGKRYVSSITNTPAFQSSLVRKFYETISVSDDKSASCWYDERYLPTFDGA